MPDTASPPLRKEHWRNIVSFFIIGLINNFGYVVMLSAADVLVKGQAPTAAVLLCDIMPCLIIQSTAAFWMHWFPYWLRILFVSLTQLLCFQLVAWCESVYLRLLGVVFASTSQGFGEVTFLALSSFFTKNTVSAWSSGTGLVLLENASKFCLFLAGAAGVAGSLSYLAFISWFGLTEIETLMAIGWVPMLIIVIYFFLLKKPAAFTRAGSRTAINSDSSGPDSLGQVEAQALLTETSQESPAAPTNSAAPAGNTPPLTFIERLRHLPHLAKYMLPLALVYFSEYLINQGILPVVRFENAPIDAKDDYRYYCALYQVGVFVSRSSANILPIKRVWIPSVLQFANLIFFVFQALYMVVPWIWVLFVLIFWEGLLGGATYVNAFSQMSIHVVPRFKEFALGVGSAASSIGITASAILGMFLEGWLKDFLHIKLA